MNQLKVREGRRAANFPKMCAFFLSTQSFMNIYGHVIHQMKAEYHSHILVTMILYNSSEVKLKIVKEI